MKILLICNYKPGVGGISGQVESLQRNLREENHTADIFSTKTSFFRRLMLPLRLRSKARNYDILHIHCCSGWGFLPAVVGVTVGRWLKKRIVLTYHGGGGEAFFDKYARLVHHYLTRTDVNIVLSGFLAKAFDKHKIRCTIIPNIIEFDKTQFRLRERLLPHYICTRAHEKLYNIPCILKAFREVQVVMPDANLVLVGNGDEHENLIRMVQVLDLKNVTFTGRVDNNDIYRQLDSADIFLSSPTIDNMPVSVLEAMNAGLLVISSSVGGVPYMVENNKTGLLFESGNDDELSKKMLWAILNQAETKDIIQQARCTVEEYCWDNIKEKLYTAYGIFS